MRRETALENVCGEAAYADVLDAAFGRPRMVWLVLFAIREYETLSQIQNGRGAGAPSLSTAIGRQRFDRREATQARRVAQGLVDLYSNHDGGNVRGALLEGLAEQQIKSRYGGGTHLCRNNVVIRLENGKVHTTSTSIDVLGWDGAVGECHDCKADSRRFRQTWIDELERNVAPRGFAVGLVTADMNGTARRKVAAKKLRWSRALLITGDTLATRLPLQP